MRRIFCEISVMNINELGTAWDASLKVMSKFVKTALGKDGFLSKSCKERWARTIYGDSSPHSLLRIKSFVENAISIRDKGYITPLDHELDSILDSFGVTIDIAGSLPRIILGDKNLIDDGRHKLAILQALGVERTPVAIIKIVKAKRECLLEYNMNLVKGIKRFKQSIAWEKYKETNDYKISRGSEIID